MEEYARYCPIEPDHVVLEPGCGVGRDAIQLAEKLSDKGRYIGFDIIKPSIDWCQANITTKFPNFTFFYLDIQSQIHNPGGQSKTTKFRLPVQSGSVDRIVLHSVFTHMFEDDITHYMEEFRRVLKPTGLVMASFFVLDGQTRKMAKANKANDLNFAYDYSDGCYINDKDFPEGAVGFTPEVIERMMQRAGLELAQEIHRGSWAGRPEAKDGQDILVMRRGKLALSNRVRKVAKDLRQRAHSRG